MEQPLNYRHIRPQYEEFTEQLEQLINKLLRKSKIDFHLVESRTKTIKSVREKLKSNIDKYSNSYNKITDLSGVRIIVYYKEDVEKVCSLITDNFDIDFDNSIDKTQLLKSHEFGYLSVHFVVQIPNERAVLSEWEKYREFKAEIQVRTVLQHSWAAISHKLQYKKNYDIPNDLKRQLFRMAGLIELADDEFENIKKRHSKIIRTIRNKTTPEDLAIKQEINLLTLRNYFDQNSALCEKIDKISAKAGFINSAFDAPTVDFYLSQLIRVVKTLKINNIKDLDHFISKNISTLFEYLRKQKEQVPIKWNTNTEFTILLFLMSFMELPELESFLIEEWNSPLSSDVLKVIKELRQK